jgi:hypothetical protein
MGAPKVLFASRAVMFEVFDLMATKERKVTQKKLRGL